MECWHLGTQELETLTRDCLLPLAPAHASAELAQSLQLASDSSGAGAVTQQPIAAAGPSAVQPVAAAGMSEALASTGTTSYAFAAVCSGVVWVTVSCTFGPVSSNTVL